MSDLRKAVRYVTDRIVAGIAIAITFCCLAVILTTINAVAIVFF